MASSSNLKFPEGYSGSQNQSINFDSEYLAAEIPCWVECGIKAGLCESHCGPGQGWLEKRDQVTLVQVTLKARLGKESLARD